MELKGLKTLNVISKIRTFKIFDLGVTFNVNDSRCSVENRFY